MTKVQLNQLQQAIKYLRSGREALVWRGEDMLIELAGLRTSMCSCPNWPSSMNRYCYAHSMFNNWCEQLSPAEKSQAVLASLAPQDAGCKHLRSVPDCPWCA